MDKILKDKAATKIEMPIVTLIRTENQILTRNQAADLTTQTVALGEEKAEAKEKMLRL